MGTPYPHGRPATPMRAPRLNVARDGTRTWKVRFRDDGKQSSRTFAVERDAKTFCQWINRYGLEDALHLLDESQGASVSDLTVAEWCAEYIDHLVSVTEGTVASYRAYIRNDLGAIGELPLTALTSRAIGGWVKAMSDSGAAGKTVSNKHGFLSACMEAAILAGHIQANPCKGTRLPKTIRKPEVFLSHDEYARFLGCFLPRWVPLVEVMFGTGLRWGEISALQVGDVDLDAETLTVSRAWKRGDGRTILGPPKTARSRRTLALAPATVTVLRPLCDDRSGGAWVFTSSTGSHVRGPYFHERVWQPALRLANGEVPYRSRGRGRPVAVHEVGNVLMPLDPPLGKRPRIHDARHSYASWLVGAGIPLNVVQAQLGHESITTTVDRYSHLLPSAQGYVRDALTLALSQSRPELLP